MSGLWDRLRALLGAPKPAPLPEPLPPPPAPQDRFLVCLEEVLKSEGGYVDHPADPGGATNLGITLATLSEWRGRTVSKADVKALTVAEAGEIYRAKYWRAVRADELPAGLDLALFDCGVNSGPGRAVKLLQAALGVAQDGLLGPRTLAAVRSAKAADLVNGHCDARLAFLRGLATWPVFGKGWAARVERVRKAALSA